MSRSTRLAARRVKQTLRFRNGAKVLADLAASRTPWGSEGLLFEVAGGLKVHCPNLPGARVPVYEVFSEDAYRYDELLEGLGQDFTVLDIGGHIGCFALGLAAARPEATIHTYEASPSTAEWLQRNVTANALGDRIHVHQKALAGEPGVLEFADNAGGSSLNGITAPTGSTTTVQVPAITFDEALAAAGDSVELVKIDVEGAEYGILAATTPASWAGVQRVVMEYHDVPGHGLNELLTTFIGAGLGLTRIETATDRQGTIWLSRDVA